MVEAQNIEIKDLGDGTVEVIETITRSRVMDADRFRIYVEGLEAKKADLARQQQKAKDLSATLTAKLATARSILSKIQPPAQKKPPLSSDTV